MLMETPATTARRRTKIVCTLGPASSSVDVIQSLITAGMDVARLNFSHGAYETHTQVIANIRFAASQLNTRVAILQDLSGPKMRIGQFEGGAVELKDGAEFVLTTRKIAGTVSGVSITYPQLVAAATEGDRILLGDGLIELRVCSATDTDINCEVIAGGPLASNKGICAPGASLAEAVPTKKDLEDLEFGLSHGVDWVAQSFVRSADELANLRSVITEKGHSVPIVAKLEKREALNDLDGIIAQADAVMVARGDLGLEIGLHEVPFAQKEIIKRTGQAGKPDITATQMLESMITNPRPTRAEVNDVANSVLDGTDAIMLSGETAVGSYPVEACATMARVAHAAEQRINYVKRFKKAEIRLQDSVPDAIAHAACQTSLDIGAKVIICCTRTGQTAQLVARYRPDAPIAVASPDEKPLHRSLLLWGAYPIKLPIAENTDQMISRVKAAVLQAKLAEPGDRVVLVAGIPVDEPGSTNMIKADIL